MSILALDFPPPLSSFSSFLSLFPILSAPPSAVLPPPPFSHPVIFYWTLKLKKVKSRRISSLFNFFFVEWTSLSRRTRAREEKDEGSVFRSQATVRFFKPPKPQRGEMRWNSTNSTSRWHFSCPFCLRYFLSLLLLPFSTFWQRRRSGF